MSTNDVKTTRERNRQIIGALYDSALESAHNKPPTITLTLDASEESVVELFRKHVIVNGVSPFDLTIHSGNEVVVSWYGIRGVEKTRPEQYEFTTNTDAAWIIILDFMLANAPW